MFTEHFYTKHYSPQKNIPDINKTVKNRTVILIIKNIISCLYSLKLNKLFQPAGSALLLFQILAPTYRALQHKALCKGKKKLNRFESDFHYTKFTFDMS